MAAGRKGDTKVRIVEVLPREGLQSVLHHADAYVPTTEEKIGLIEAIASTGVAEIEITNFAHPKVIPGLADAEAVTRRARRVPGVTYRAVVPNERGMQRGIDAGIQKVTCLIAASETYSAKNSNMSIAQNLEQIRTIHRMAQAAGVEVAVGMAICFVCSYEGPIPESRVEELAAQLVDMGIGEITVADSVGVATPAHVASLTGRLLDRWPDLDLGLHLHDLAGFALANVYAAYQSGVRIFESALCGLGGGIVMPIDVRMMGNVPTEDVVYLLERMGVDTGIDVRRLVEVGRGAERLFRTQAASRVLGARLLEGLLPAGDFLGR